MNYLDLSKQVRHFILFFSLCWGQETKWLQELKFWAGPNWEKFKLKKAEPQRWAHPTCLDYCSTKLSTCEMIKYFCSTLWMVCFVLFFLPCLLLKNEKFFPFFYVPAFCFHPFPLVRLHTHLQTPPPPPLHPLPTHTLQEALCIGTGPEWVHSSQISVIWWVTHWKRELGAVEPAARSGFTLTRSCFLLST